MENLAYVLTIGIVLLGTWRLCDAIHDFTAPRIGDWPAVLVTVILVGSSVYVIANYGEAESTRTVKALKDCIHDDSWDVLDNCRRDYPYESD